MSARAEIQCYFDGCCEPTNPGGTAAFGAVIYLSGIRIWECSRVFTPKSGGKIQTSNNVAEYQGVIAILEWLLEQQFRKSDIQINGDSMLVCCQMQKQKGQPLWKIRQGLYVPHARNCKKLLRKFPRVRFKWIPRDENNLADELSKRELIRLGVEFRIQPIEEVAA